MGWLNQNPLDQIIQKATDLATLSAPIWKLSLQNKKSKYNENEEAITLFLVGVLSLSCQKKRLPDLQCHFNYH